MPIIYLSPSTQENNYFVNGGTEEQYMNLIADKMIPYLDASGIGYTRNMPGMTASGSIAASNAGNYDLHLALHSNAAPDDRYGSVRGSIVFYYPGSLRGQRAGGSSPMDSKPSIPSRTWYAVRELLLSGKFVWCVPPQFFWNLPITTMTTMPTGSPKTSLPSHETLSCH